MKKLIGLRRTKTSIFISGKGSNLKNLIKFSIKKKSPISIELIISNTKKAKGLKYSNQYNILKKIFNFNNNIDEKKLLTLLIKKK
jgi:phosphoribosylglycinamide formyltransferase-1